MSIYIIIYYYYTVPSRLPTVVPSTIPTTGYIYNMYTYDFTFKFIMFNILKYNIVPSYTPTKGYKLYTLRFLYIYI